LGKQPDSIAFDGRYTFLTPEESAMMGHDRWAPSGVKRMPVSFGANVRGNVYYNPDVKKPAPAVIWLHPFSYGSGYNEGYQVDDTTIYHRLAQQGYVVLAFDQCGFGLRLLEGRDFYEHYPQWSRLGRMVYDVRAAVDFLHDGKGAAQGEMPAVDPEQIHVLGFSLGGMVGLYATALDERIAVVASIAGFTPLRTDSDDKPTGGNRRLYQWHALQPKLGLFTKQESKIPYDFDDVLRLIAPRRCLIVAPRRDRFATFDEVVACVERAKSGWLQAGRADALTFSTPDDISQFRSPQQRDYLDWLAAGRAAPGGN
jgi:pimeloyl-ACP methyl ester carboxylesterase